MSDTIETKDAAPKKAPPANPNYPYAIWLRGKAEEQDMSYAEIGRRIGKDYNYVWRFAAGLRKRPEFAGAVAIGEVVNDVEGSLTAAEYKTSSVSSSRKKRIVVGEIEGTPVAIEVGDNISEEKLKRIRLAMQIALAPDAQ